MCRATGKVSIETVTHAQFVAFLWRCSNCDHSWAVRAIDEDDSGSASEIAVH
jgi:hypothetical protein